MVSTRPTTRVCRLNTAVPAVSVVQRHSICRYTTRELYKFRGSQPLDGRQPFETERRQDRIAWVGSGYGSTSIGSSGPSVRLGSKVITAIDHILVLGVTVSSDPSVNKHVFEYLCNVLSQATPTRPTVTRHRMCGDTGPCFVTSQVDCCNTVLAGSPKSTTERLQRVLNAAARAVSN